MNDGEISCFVLSSEPETDFRTAEELRRNTGGAPVFFIKVKNGSEGNGGTGAAAGGRRLSITTGNPESTETFEKMCRRAGAPYVLWYRNAGPLKISAGAIGKMLMAAKSAGAAIVYADYYEEAAGVAAEHPLTDCTPGSVTDDFDFGQLLLICTEALKEYFNSRAGRRYSFAGFYDFRLFASRSRPVVHISECLYTVTGTDMRPSGQRQFDYTDPSNRKQQAEMERAFTGYLKSINAYIPPEEAKRVDFTEESFDTEASVIIPVRNRVSTIKDAVESALSQKTDFPFNVIVADNHSDDGTSEILDRLKADKRLIRITPKRTGLGIGGCWELAVKSRKCGRFAVQLDSDDLYADENALQTIVNKFRRTHAAMVIGSYRIVNFNLETLPPGVIDHKEWTSGNGRNNALRVNGLGAPRAFYTPLLRKTGVPDTSYGEDYALGLVFSREHHIARIFDVIYLCRRWEGNSDAALPQAMINKNNAYKNSLRAEEILQRQRLNKMRQHHAGQSEVTVFFNRQLAKWEEVRERFSRLKNAETKDFRLGDARISAQFNPVRINSASAKTDKRSISRRPCFLCDANRPAQQISLPAEGRYQILVNPFPILPCHLVIASRFHEPQSVRKRYGTLAGLAKALSGFTVFYNGPESGASAPDHMHFQAGRRNVMPLEKDWDTYSRKLKRICCIKDREEHEEGIFEITNYACPAIAIVAKSEQDSEKYFRRLSDVLEQPGNTGEYPMNIIAWSNGGKIVSVVFLRKKLRPQCYFEHGESRILVSPGAADMCGLLITPRKEDFEKLSPEKAFSILKEVSISEEETEQIARRLHGGENQQET